MIALDFKAAKANFLDSPAVLARVEKNERRTLARSGGFIRTTARRSIRRRKRVSQPGEPPSAHAASGDFASLKTIFFAFDFRTRSVVIGPVGLNIHHYYQGKLSKGTVPEVLEKGGTIGIREKRMKATRYREAGRWRTGRRKPRPWEETRVRLATYAPRPFMAPALQVAIDRGVLPKNTRGLLAA